MLIISRKKHQKLIIADDIEITILEVGRNRVRFGVKAPKHVNIQTHLKSDPDTTEDHSKKFGEQPIAFQDFPLAVGLSKRL